MTTYYIFCSILLICIWWQWCEQVGENWIFLPQLYTVATSVMFISIYSETPYHWSALGCLIMFMAMWVHSPLPMIRPEYFCFLFYLIFLTFMLQILPILLLLLPIFIMLNTVKEINEQKTLYTMKALYNTQLLPWLLYRRITETSV